MESGEELVDPAQRLDLAGLAPDEEGAEHEVLLDGHGAEDPAPLGGLGHAEAHDLVAWVLKQVDAVEDDAAFHGVHKAADGEQGRALARAVGAEQGHNLAFVHVQGDAVQHLHLAVGDVEILDFQEGHG